MLGKLLRMYLYTQLPKKTFTLLHPIKSVRARKVSYDVKHAYAPRLTALATALLVGPLAYRLGRRSAQGTLLAPRGRPIARSEPPASE